MYIKLNPRWRAKILDDDRYVLFKRMNDSTWEIHDRLEGSRRVLFRRLNTLGIVVSATAQKQLDSIPECAGFRPDPVEDEEA